MAHQNNTEIAQVSGKQVANLLEVTKEGRDGIYLVDKVPLKKWLKAKGFKTIHNFIPNGMMMIGADHDIKSVFEDIDNSERIAILTGSNANMGHELAIIRNNQLECYDIGTIKLTDMLVTSPDADSVSPQMRPVIPPPQSEAGL